MGGHTFQGLTLQDLIFILLNGVGTLPVSFALLTIGPSLISAPEVSLYSLIETVLGPIWVWVGGYGAPSKYSVIGGFLLISALVTNRFVYNYI
jgi:hypothetical protein